MTRLKALRERHASILAQMEAIQSAAVDENGEQRALNEEETAQFDALEASAKALKESIEREERAVALTLAAAEAAPTTSTESPTKGAEERAADEVNVFADYLRGRVTESRAAGDPVNLTFGDNGAVVPTTIANKIIDIAKEMCPIWMYATTYNVPGTLTIPYYDTTGGDIAMSYVDEFTPLASTSGAFQSITLQSYLAGVLTLVSKKLLNNSNFDLVSFVERKMAENVARWLEKELFIGTNNKIVGLSGATQVKRTAAASAITLDDLIQQQEMLLDQFRGNAFWIMTRETRAMLRQIKDKEDRYILNPDATARWGYKLLGSDVAVTEQGAFNLGTATTSQPLIWYGDYSGLAVKFNEQFTIDVLREQYATQHAIGIYGYMDVDSKIENQQKITVLKKYTS